MPFNERLLPFEVNKMLNISNVSSGEGCDESDDIKHIALFATSTAISVLLAIVAVIGNGIVIYRAGQKRYGEALKHLSQPVRSLAVTDLLIGVIAIPLIITYYILG